MLRPKPCLLAVFFLMAGACNSSPGGPDGGVCTLEARPAITVFVRDSVSGAHVARGSVATATSGTFSDMATYPAGAVQDDLPLSLAHERAGTYTVTVTKPGYSEWRTTGVRVTRDECHVVTETLTARLQVSSVM